MPVALPWKVELSRVVRHSWGSETEYGRRRSFATREQAETAAIRLRAQGWRTYVWRR